MNVKFLSIFPMPIEVISFTSSISTQTAGLNYDQSSIQEEKKGDNYDYEKWDSEKKSTF